MRATHFRPGHIALTDALDNEAVPDRADDAPDRAVWISLAAGAVLLVQPANPTAANIGSLIAVIAVLAMAVSVAALRERIGVLAIVLFLAAGVALRFATSDVVGSDVLDVTSAAIRRVLSGGNPYGFAYTVSRPAGAPFPYGPLTLLWYLPAEEMPRMLELLVGTVILALLAVRGRLLGLAVYATAPTLILTASDGSNDTSAGFLLLVAFILARRRPIYGALGLAAVVAFKPYAAAWLPAFLIWGGLPALLAFAAASLVLWAPVLFLWGPGSFLESLRMADAVHHGTYWSLGSLYEGTVFRSAPRAFLDTFRYIAGGAVALVTLLRVRSLDGVILAGTLVFLVTLFFGYWSTYAYFAAIAPVLCWRIDDWVGFRPRPILAA
jgi:hypothetical protein